jgi:hypothetical protein
MSIIQYDPCEECQAQPKAPSRSKYCNDCAPKVHRRQRAAAANRMHERVGGHQAFHLQQRYGISVEQYEEMVTRQKMRCAICKRKTTKLHVDHDHETKRVRALLCRSCNTGIGKLGDDSSRLRAAAEYIEEHKCR